jgi:hypothetical protein
MPGKQALVPAERIERAILLIRGQNGTANLKSQIAISRRAHPTGTSHLSCPLLTSHPVEGLVVSPVEPTCPELVEGLTPSPNPAKV